MKLLWWQDPRILSGLDKYRALSQRERKLILVTSHVVVAAVFILFVASVLGLCC